MRPKFSEAIAHALTALELSGLRDDDADHTAAAPTAALAATAVNEFERRPLPFLIGTQAFLDDDFIGLAVPEEPPQGAHCPPLLLLCAWR